MLPVRPITSAENSLLLSQCCLPAQPSTTAAAGRVSQSSSQLAARSSPPLALSRPTIFPSDPRNFGLPAPTSLESQRSLVRVYVLPSVDVSFPAGQFAEIL